MGLLSLEHSKAACLAGFARHGLAVLDSLSSVGSVEPGVLTGCPALPGAPR